ncbi:hypothetical protein EV363DRAFT_1286829 [Boletus edulis]|nr:hypothetical protein EV363DRAFT_1286829 [Boletus edulis]
MAASSPEIIEVEPFLHSRDSLEFISESLDELPPPKISFGGQTIVTFAGNAKYVVGGAKLNVIQVRRVADGQPTASLRAEGVFCLAASKDGRWIAAGTERRELVVWDAQTYQRVFEHKESYAIVQAVDFSPDSTQLMSSTSCTATVWDITTSRRLQTLGHQRWLIAAKYSPQGDRIATATPGSVHIWDNTGRFLADIKVPVSSSRNKSLLWFGNHLFIISDSKIKQFEASTCSAIAEWRVPHGKDSCIALPLHGKFIAYSARHTVTIWDTSTHAQSGLIQNPQEITSLAFSPDDRFLAIGALDGEITIQDLKYGLTLNYSVHHSFISPTLHSIHDDKAEASLTDTIPSSGHQSHKGSLIRVLIKRSKAYAAAGLWEPALNDANKVIELDPSSPWGYERKHAMLHKAGDYDNATRAFEAMLSKMSQSSDPKIHKIHRQYLDVKAAIRDVIQDIIRDCPRVLINTNSGRLLNKAEQAMAFESLPVFNELIASMTTNIDHARIKHDVTQFYRYAMLSHAWEDNEPLFEELMHIIVYDLEESPTNDKLKMFCKIIQDAGLHWAWSDTCCINKGDHSVLQAALVAMFKWYQGSTLTLVFLRGVRSPSRRGDLVRSIWNSRAWTLLEYRASKVVRFYNEDWTLYMNLDIPNHKDSPEILLEMEEAMGVSARTLMALQPGLDNIRENLSLVSRRETTLVEDAAYSLFGIFSVSMPVIYGEGDQALGRLLAQLLTRSGEMSILAWTGKSGSFNSCFPDSIRVFSQPLTSHIPPLMTYTELETVTSTLRKTPFNLALAVKLYDRLWSLPVPPLTRTRITLPCLVFKLGPVTSAQSASGRVFRTKTDALGTVEIRTTEDLSRFDSLTLVHPWIDFLLDRHPMGSMKAIPEKREDPSSPISEPHSLPSPSRITVAEPQSRAVRFASRFELPFGARRRAATSRLDSLPSPSAVSLTDEQARAIILIARLRQPFGALLFTQTREDVAEYRRVASESLITARVPDDTPLQVLIASAQTLDVL